MGDRRAQRAHREGHHVHRAALHAALEEAAQRLPHLGRVAPVVGRAGVVLVLGADEGAVLDPGDVGRGRRGRGRSSGAWRRRGARRCPRRSGPGRGRRTPRRSRRTSGWRRAGSGRRSPRPSRGALRAWSALWPRWFGSFAALYSLAGFRGRIDADVGVRRCGSSASRSSFLPSARSTVHSKVVPGFDLDSEGQSTEATFSLSDRLSRSCLSVSSVLASSITVSPQPRRRAQPPRERSRAARPSRTAIASLQVGGCPGAAVSQAALATLGHPAGARRSRSDRVPRR